MSLLCPLIKISEMVPFGLTKWPPELKIETGHRLSNVCQQFTLKTSPPKPVNGF